MLLPHGTVFAVVDGEKFELYRNTGTTPEPKLEAIEIPDLAETNKSAGMRHHAHTGSASDERLGEDAHVTSVVDWLNDQVLAHKIDNLVVIADPRSLGEMRRRYHRDLKETLICDLDKTMTGRSGEEIVKALRSK
jgi:protein required for attachment to host cells